MKTHICSLLSLLAVCLFASTSSADFVIQNSFTGGDWDSSGGVATVLVGTTFSDTSDNLGLGALWTVDAGPVDLETGVVFSKGPVPTGAISTDFLTINGAEYTVTWSVAQTGTPSSHTLTASAGGSMQTLGSGPGGFTFTGTGSAVSLSIGTNGVGGGIGGGGGGIALTSVAVSVPEPTTLGLGLGLVGLAFFRRRRLA